MNIFTELEREHLKALIASGLQDVLTGEARLHVPTKQVRLGQASISVGLMIMADLANRGHTAEAASAQEEGSFRRNNIFHVMAASLYILLVSQDFDTYEHAGTLLARCGDGEDSMLQQHPPSVARDTYKDELVGLMHLDIIPLGQAAIAIGAMVKDCDCSTFYHPRTIEVSSGGNIKSIDVTPAMLYNLFSSQLNVAMGDCQRFMSSKGLSHILNKSPSDFSPEELERAAARAAAEANAILDATERLRVAVEALAHELPKHNHTMSSEHVESLQARLMQPCLFATLKTERAVTAAAVVAFTQSLRDGRVAMALSLEPGAEIPRAALTAGFLTAVAANAYLVTTITMPILSTCKYFLHDDAAKQQEYRNVVLTTEDTLRRAYLVPSYASLSDAEMRNRCNSEACRLEGRATSGPTSPTRDTR